MAGEGQGWSFGGRGRGAGLIVNSGATNGVQVEARVLGAGTRSESAERQRA